MGTTTRRFFNGLIRVTTNPPPLRAGPGPVVLGGVFDPSYALLEGNRKVEFLYENTTVNLEDYSSTQLVVAMGRSYVGSGKWYVELGGASVTSRNRVGFGYDKFDSSAPGKFRRLPDLLPAFFLRSTTSKKLENFENGYEYCFALDMDNKKLWFRDWSYRRVERLGSRGRQPRAEHRWLGHIFHDKRRAEQQADLLRPDHRPEFPGQREKPLYRDVWGVPCGVL